MDVNQTGAGAWTFGYAAMMPSIAFIRGGTHQVAHAAHKILCRDGAKFFLGAEVEKAIIENGEAKGIQLSDGSQIKANKLVVSTLNPQQLCFDMIDAPDQVQRLVDLAIEDFETIYDHFDNLLKQAGQLSVSWMGIPSYGRMHIPSCDFSTMISPRFFEEFGLQILEREVQTMTHNIFHVDGKGVARHLNAILSVPEVHAIQWVQGVGDDLPIMQWVPFIKELQAKKVPIIVDLNLAELESFMDEMNPQGLFLWVATENEQEELEILKRIERWT